MADGVTQPELQRRTLRLYGELLCRRENWAGKLVVACFGGAAGVGFGAAASLAGAASLTVDADGAGMKAHFRDGGFDFLVNTLDEALRALKNEVRKGRAIAIGLIGEPLAVQAEMDERGVQADFALRAGNALSEELQGWLRERGWAEREVGAEAAFEDAVRSRWMRELAKHQRSVRGGLRWVWLTPDEAEELPGGGINVSPE